MQQFVKTKAGLLFVREGGKGLPVIMWPSVFMTHAMWEAQVHALSRWYSVIAIDPPGHGQSASINKSITVDDCADIITEIMDVQGLKKAIIAGVSWGGMVAISFAARFPERCLGIAILNSSARNASMADRIMNAPLVPLLRRFGFGTILQNIAVNQLLGKTSRKEHPALIDRIKGQLVQLIPVNAAIVARDIFIGRQDQRNRLGSILCPTLIMSGEEDVSFPPYHSEELRDHIQDSTLILLKKVGHLAPLEASEAVNEALMAFFQRLEAPEM